MSAHTEFLRRFEKDGKPPDRAEEESEAAYLRAEEESEAAYLQVGRVM